MKYVNAETSKNVIKSFIEDRHGVIVKIMNANGIPIGYFVRGEVMKCDNDDEVYVGIHMSFNTAYYYKTDEWENGWHFFKSSFKYFHHHEIKYFNVKKIMDFNPANTIGKFGGWTFYSIDNRNGQDSNFAYFTEAMASEVNLLLNDMVRMRNALADRESPEYKTCGLENIGDYEEFRKYIHKNIMNVFKYYKNKKINLFFL